jgi:hypothetical protein
LKELKVLFNTFDIDNSNDVSIDEFKKTLKTLGYRFDDEIRIYFFKNQENLSFEGKLIIIYKNSFFFIIFEFTCI